MATASLLSPELAADALLSPEQAAEYLGSTPGTLCVWRCNRRVKIPFCKIGKKVMYRRADLEAYIAANIVGQAAE